MEGKAKKNIIADNRKIKELISISLINIFFHPLFIYIILESVAGGGGFDFDNFFFVFGVNFLLDANHFLPRKNNISRQKSKAFINDYWHTSTALDCK